jgi:hypothetical protein
MREKEIKNRCILLLFVFQYFSQKYSEMIKDFFFPHLGKKKTYFTFWRNFASQNKAASSSS